MDYNKLGKDILTQVGGAKKMLAVLVTVSRVFALF